MAITLTAAQGASAIVHGALTKGRYGEVLSLTVLGYFAVFCCADRLVALRGPVLVA